MSNSEIVKKGLRAWEANDEATFSNLLTDDFVLIGPVPQPLGKAEFIGFMHAMLAALPDFKFNDGTPEERGNTVIVKTHISGTHTGTLTLPGLPAVPATGKKVQLPEETQTITITNGKVSKIEVNDVPGGGVPGLLAQLGVKLG